MRLFFSELRKLLGNVKILLVIAAAAVINVMFLVVPEFEEYSPSAYNALWDILEEMNPDERTDYVAQRIAASDDSRRFTGSSETEFTDNFYSEQELLQYVYNELSQVEGYSDYLNSIDQSAENMKTLSFFADEDSFNYRNIIKTTEDFSRLSADNVGYGRSKGILLALRFGITDILLFLLIVIFGVKLISSERESGFFPLLQSTANGKIRLAAAKLSAVILSGLLIALRRLFCGGGVSLRIWRYKPCVCVGFWVFFLRNTDYGYGIFPAFLACEDTAVYCNVRIGFCSTLRSAEQFGGICRYIGLCGF